MHPLSNDIFVFLDFLISFEICLTPKLLKYTILLAFTCKAIKWVLLIYTHRDLLHMPYPLF